MADQHDNQQAEDATRDAAQNQQVQPQDSAQTLVYMPVLDAEHPEVSTPSQTNKLVVFPNGDSQNRASDHTVRAPGAPGHSNHFAMTPSEPFRTDHSPGTARSIRRDPRSPPTPPAAKLQF